MAREIRGELSVFTETTIASIRVGEFFAKGIPHGADAPVVRRWTTSGFPGILSAWAEGQHQVRAIVREELPGTKAADYEQHVEVVWKPLHFGGARPAFVCPECGRPVRTLHLHRSLSLRCARCADLRYASRSPGHSSAAVAKARRLRVRLGGPTIPGAPLPVQPPRMHRRTYERLIDELCEIESALFPDASRLHGSFAAWQREMVLARRAEQERGPAGN
jgi:hypothetical protein